jgi:FkbM family methyltransferase
METKDNNVITYNTKYGLVSLLKNELYIGNVFKSGQYWDEDTLFQLKKYINPEYNILEIGGHCGTSSIIYASYLSENSKIYVYEPQLKMFEILLQNINQNNLQDKIIPKKMGIFCYEGIGNMNNIDLDGGGGEVQKRYNEECELSCNFGGICLGNGGEQIQLTTIDKINVPNIGFIHCDAQGSENFIFSKSTDVLNKYKPVILYENNQEYGKYLYENVCNTYSDYVNESKFDVKKYCVENLQYSFIDKYNKSIDTLLIPPQPNFEKVIYITNKTIDEKLKNVANQWLQLNPEYTVELYDDKRCLDFLLKYYGQKYCDIFHYIKDGPIKCDFFRACIIYVYGGVYADADIRPIVPLNIYVDDDVDFMTCISYNYKKYETRFCYNPHFIVSKKYSTELYEIMKTYEEMYDTQIEYQYWKWSICNIFEKIHDFDISSSSNNIFFHNNKKYKFIIEQMIEKTNGTKYTFENFIEDKYRLLNTSISVICTYMGNPVLNNFDNK